MISKTQIKISEEIENGLRYLCRIKDEDAIELARDYLDEYKKDSKTLSAIVDFLNYRDDSIYNLKCRIARSVIEESEDLDIMFDEKFNSHVEELHNTGNLGKFYDRV